MSSKGLYYKNYAYEFVCGKDFLNTLSPQEREDEERRVLTKTFYWNAMAKRITLSTFAIYVTLLRFSNNRHYFPFTDLDLGSGNYERLMIFVVIMFVTEWLVTAIVYVTLIRVYNIDAMRVGGRTLMNAHARRMAVVFAVHILMDSYISLNKLKVHW